MNDKFDLVFSSHNMEHVLDLIQHMLDVEKLLMPNGYFSCIVPDRRFTFDYFRHKSSLADVVAQKDIGQEIMECSEAEKLKLQISLKITNRRISRIRIGGCSTMILLLVCSQNCMRMVLSA